MKRENNKDTGISLVKKHKLKMKQKYCNHWSTKSIDSETVVCIYCGKDVTN